MKTMADLVTVANLIVLFPIQNQYITIVLADTANTTSQRIS